MTDHEVISPFKSLSKETITQIFDVERDKKGTWCTIEFSNGEVHFAHIPYLFVWDGHKERKLLGGCIELVSDRLIEEDEWRYVLLHAPYIIWLPIEQKNPDRSRGFFTY